MAICSSAQVFCCVEKSAEFFAQSSTNYSQVPREKNRVTRKNKNVLFNILKALLKTLMKIFLPKLEYLRPQSIKSLFLWKKKNQNVHWIRKMKNWEISRRKIAYNLEVSRPKKRNEKAFFWEKIPNCSSANVFSCFDKTTATFVPNLWQKRSGSKNTLPHLECTFKNTVENSSAEAQTFKLKSKKSLNLW